MIWPSNSLKQNRNGSETSKFSSDWFKCEYIEEINAFMKEKELKRSFVFRSPQLPQRPSLIYFLRKVCKDFCLSTQVFHLSALLLDHFMDDHSIENEKLRPIALTCLLVAAKYDELDDKIPKPTDLIKYSKGFSVSDLILLEAVVVRNFNWAFGAPTAVHFVFYYAHCSIQFDLEHLKALSPIEYRQNFMTLVIKYLDLSITDVVFLNYRSSLVAASCVLLARSDFNQDPLWPQHLKQITGYSIVELFPCRAALISCLLKDKDMSVPKRKSDDNIDPGYESTSPHDAKRMKYHPFFHNAIL